jgi:hypothetical protein
VVRRPRRDWDRRGRRQGKEASHKGQEETPGKTFSGPPWEAILKDTRVRLRTRAAQAEQAANMEAQRP